MSDAAHIIGVMEKDKSSIVLGQVRLTQDSEGQVLAWHAALSTPVQIDPKQLQRWLLAKIRELVVA